LSTKIYEGVKAKLDKRPWLKIIIFLILNSCKSAPSGYEPFSFLIAGHTYGKPGVNNKGLQPPFVEKAALLNDELYDIHFGFLTGDIVWIPTEEDWDYVDEDLSNFNFPFYMVAGNHDVPNKNARDMFTERYGHTYYSLSYNEDLFITLDPNING
jgi:hypothetical protein